MDGPTIISSLEVPATLEAAMDPAWLTQALGAKVVAVEQVELLRTVATKIRFAVRLEGRAEPGRFCLKGLLDVDEATALGGPTMVREADFYSRIAPHVDVRVPRCEVAIIAPDRQRGAIIMRDLIAEGARFCTALEPFPPDDAAASLGQIARLHAASHLLADADWITPRVGQLARAQYVTVAQLQAMLDGPRGEGLPSPVRNAAVLVHSMQALAERDAQWPDYLVHGDAHAGNIFRCGAGTGLIDWQLLQRGGWALDVAYHIAGVLAVEDAEREERGLLHHYLEAMRSLGCAVPSDDEAWRQYREALVYGYYLWSITRRVEPELITLFVNRLGSAVARHDSFALLTEPL